MIILEHKSAPDPLVHFQILRYIVAFYSQTLKERQAPVPVLPVLFYHGRSPWTLPTRLSDLLETPESIRPFTPDFKLLTIALGRIDDNTIMQKVSNFVVKSLVLSMKHIFNREIRRYFSAILQPFDAEKVPRKIMRETLELSIRYLSNVYHRLYTEEILSELNTVLKEEKLPDVIDLLREMSFQKGCQEDIEPLLRKKILFSAQIAEVLEVVPAW